MRTNHTTKRRFDLVTILFGPRPEPQVDPVQPLSGFLVGETKADRIERIATDATELCRRMYAGLPYSRRAMQPLGMGQRRWGSAWSFLNHAGIVRADGTLNYADQVLARREIAMCREHHLYALKRGQYAPPF